jgi:prophage antirepressor-like protein
MNNLQIFNYQGKQEVRTIEKDGEVWFVAKDVCEILELTNVSMSVERLDEDEKLVSKLFTSGQEREVWTVNEPGLYSLIVSSYKPEAKSFKRWITHEVIPSIRKTGSYTAPNAIIDKKQIQLDIQIEKERRLMAREKRLSANFLKEMASDFAHILSPKSVQQLVYEASKLVCNIEVIERPVLECKFWQAGEIGELAGVSGNIIGRTANKYNLKTEEFGNWILDKSQYSSKQVSSFVYNEKGKEKILEILSGVKGE